MKTSYYYAGTLITWAFVLLLSSLIGSVTTVFNFVSAFSITATTFIFPALFYSKGVIKFGGETEYYRRLSYIMYAVGTLNCIVALSSTVLNIIYG